MGEKRDVGDDVEPAAELLDVAARVVPGWLRRVTVVAAARGGVEPDDLAAELDVMVRDTAVGLLAALHELLATDVDAQRSNPLALFRRAVSAPTALLARAGAVPPPPDPFASAAFPDDPYRLGPATWSDVDPALQEPGIVWGAWKAMTVMRRHRDRGAP